ncbi:hypothetical protein BDN71DRAFT_1514293 [Pleurotus eryngii]|uniref:Uncharacterized protein n=1 Tax=Pleurotus eryngii TaxID=5323 RepID=A0A9P5ZGP6_PLEER|nr:hypothetical protein BDN71DRAFT_1514293 [Pleurotus eryngii]
MSFPPVSLDDLAGVFVLAMAIEDGVVVCRLVRAEDEADVEDENGVASFGETIGSLVDEHPFVFNLFLFAVVAHYVAGLLGVLLYFISATT